MSTAITRVNPCDAMDERAAAGVKPVAIGDASVLSDLRCDEASMHSREFYIPCNAPAAAIVTNRRQTVVMCLPCAWHNVRNRGARLLMTTDAALIT